MTLADRLKQTRESTIPGRTQKEMAKECSISVQMWQAYEAGKSVPGGNVLEALARLGFNVNWILTGVGPIKLHEEEIKLLLCKEKHEKLKARIRSFAATPTRLYSVAGFPFEQIQAYLKGGYRPDYDQIVSLCKCAGAAFSDKEFIDVITSVDLKSIDLEMKSGGTTGSIGEISEYSKQLLLTVIEAILESKEEDWNPYAFPPHLLSSKELSVLIYIMFAFFSRPGALKGKGNMTIHSSLFAKMIIDRQNYRNKTTQEVQAKLISNLEGALDFSGTGSDFLSFPIDIINELFKEEYTQEEERS